MRRISKLGLVPLFVAVLMAAERPSWKNAPVSQWSEEDAKQVLTDSPWVKKVQLDQVRNLSEFERRDGGDWEAGIGRGVGFAGLGLFGGWRARRALEQAHARAELGEVEVRWESALPVRTAESKAGETAAPAWQGSYYAIAVYDLPRPFRWNLANELKGVAFLKRGNKKDVRPSRVVVLPKTDELATYVYLFPRTIEITKQDRNLGFMAQIGRLFVYLNFFPDEMQVQGELQL